jgi:Ca2+-binding RTX toxin-like protein
MPGPGRDRLVGGDGWDYALYWDARAGIWADLRGAQGGGRDRLAEIEGLAGSRFADVLTGDANVNALYGYRGRDRLRGRGGDDRLFGGRSSDVLDGGPGADLLDGGAGRDRCLRGEQLRNCP